jgi:hypothetical protein
MGLDGERHTVVVLDIKLGFKPGTVLGRKFDIKVGLDSFLGIRVSSELGSELGAAKSKMNISVPTGNRRLWQEEDMIAFVAPSSLSVLATEAVLG